MKNRSVYVMFGIGLLMITQSCKKEDAQNAKKALEEAGATAELS